MIAYRLRRFWCFVLGHKKQKFTDGYGTWCSRCFDLLPPA